MCCKHVDFIAVLIITLGLLAFSHASEFMQGVSVSPIGFQKAVINGPSCPLANQIRGRIESLEIR